jgi:hypothetical protein
MIGCARSSAWCNPKLEFRQQRHVATVRGVAGHLSAELGSYEHRNIALQEVRFAIEDATRDRQNKMIFDALRHFRLPHRLMDFNNLPETRFEDIHNVLRAAATRVAARLNAARGERPSRFEVTGTPSRSRCRFHLWVCRS